MAGADSADRPRYLVPDYRAVVAGARDLDDALARLEARYGEAVSHGALDLGALDELLEPFVGSRGARDPADRETAVREVADRELDARLHAFWDRLATRFAQVAVHATLGPHDSGVLRAILRVDRQVRRAVPDLALRVGPTTPVDVLREAVLTACADGKPALVNDPIARAVLGTGGVAGPDAGYARVDGNLLPRGGGAYAVVRLDPTSCADVRAETGRALAALADRARHVVERAGWFDRSRLVADGLVSPDRFTVVLRLTGPAGDDGSDRSDGAERTARLVARVAEVVAATPVPYCAATGGRALLSAEALRPSSALPSSCASSSGSAGSSSAGSSGSSTAGSSGSSTAAPCADGPAALYGRVRAAAPVHRHLTGGAADVLTFEPAVEGNPDAVIDVMRGAFALGLRTVSVDVAGNGFSRVTGYLKDERDLPALRRAAATVVADIRAGRRLPGNRPVGSRAG